MKKIIMSLILIGSFFDAFCQINVKDSTAQVIGYWSVGDKQTFDISYEKYKIKEKDTTARSMIKYEVDITIKDSTANSYIIEWLYKNYKIDTTNEFEREIAKMSENISVLIKTDEYGAVEEVINWEEVRDYIKKTIEPLREKLKEVSGLEQVLNKMMVTYDNKEAIEANAIKDAIQFYTFHGVHYTLKEELKGQIEFANNLGGKPFDAEVTFSLDEINAEDDNVVLRMYQEVDSDQLTKVTYDYLERLGVFGENKPDREKLPKLTTEVWTASRVHGNTGWTTYSIETKEIKSQDVISIEERIIQIK